MTESDGRNKRQRQQAARLTVIEDGSSDYDAVGTALEVLGDEEEPPSRVLIKEGVYREWLEIKRLGIILEGQSAGGTVTTGGLSTGMIMEDDSKRRTLQTYNVLVDTHDFTAKNLTIEDSAGPGEVAGQALALHTDGDRALLKGCKPLGGQDTLFTGPFPPKEVQKDGFIGPKQLLSRMSGCHCYQDCFTRGDIDSIFGSITAYFDGRELYSAGRNTEKKGYVTAAPTPKRQKYGYAFRNCRFTGNSSHGSVYLGRPWRDYARAVLVNYCLGPHICREGWHDWDKKNACSTLLYGEHGSYGSRAEEQKAVEQGKRDHCTLRPDWVLMPTRGQMQDYTMEQVLGGTDGWNPGACI